MTRAGVLNAIGHFFGRRPPGCLAARKLDAYVGMLLARAAEPGGGEHVACLTDRRSMALREWGLVVDQLRAKNAGRARRLLVRQRRPRFSLGTLFCGWFLPASNRRYEHRHQQHRQLAKTPHY